MRTAICLTVLLAGCVHHEGRPSPEQVEAASAAHVESDRRQMDADCGIAEVAQRYDATMACAKWKMRLDKNTAGAVALWRAAVHEAGSRDEACAPVSLILQNSGSPSKDVDGIDPVLIQLCMRAEQVSADAKTMALQQRQACQMQCDNNYNACILSESNGWARVACATVSKDCARDCARRY